MRKRSTALCLSSFLAIAALSAGAAPAAVSAPAGAAAPASALSSSCRVTAKAAVVRAKPSKGSAKVGIAHRGDRCVEYGYDKSLRWVKVRIKKSGVTGWVRHSLVDTNQHAASRPQ
ncbi:SH3 domain-containing protein [Streptomyces sp. CA-250714]|uniref:SH3 domain-containing protein n=1 Tax=Streptomyces sp. CA-250714 TaxID=3240060 RepID=UPI003D8B79B4